MVGADYIRYIDGVKYHQQNGQYVRVDS